MSIKRYVNGQWIEVAGGTANSGKAINVSVDDKDEFYDNHNVEGILNEIGYELQNINNELDQHKNNHPSGGGGGNMPTITSEFIINKSDGVSYINIPIFIHTY